MNKKRNFRIVAITVVAFMLIAGFLCSGSLFASGVSKANNKTNIEATVQESTGSYDTYIEADIYEDAYDSQSEDVTGPSDDENNVENEQVENNGPKYSEEDIQNILNEIKGNGLKNNPLRQEYESKVAGLTQYADELFAKGLSEKEVAQLLHQARRNLGVEYKDATPQPLRDYIYYVNMGRYGDKLGPTYEWLIVEKGSTDAKIIESATRPNSNIDKLLAGFEEWLREQ